MSDAKEGRVLRLDECPDVRGMLVQVPASNLRRTVEALAQAQRDLEAARAALRGAKHPLTLLAEACEHLALAVPNRTLRGELERGARAARAMALSMEAAALSTPAPKTETPKGGCCGCGATDTLLNEGGECRECNTEAQWKERP